MVRDKDTTAEKKQLKRGLSTWIYIALYLGAIVSANLLVAEYGPRVAIVNAFLFIGFDLTARDRLHITWGENRLHLILKMGALIAAGSLITYLFNQDAAQIAWASIVAFAAAGIVDTITFQLLRKKRYFTRVNVSNIVSAAVDSVVFPVLAFGSFSIWIALGLFAAKVLGGVVWAVIFINAESE